ncbi:MAG: hypothetical protein PHR13_11780 [Dysgonamonadaceae bacterium]|nr:hypothetical protein [Dysgonamonadaceae bacterium]
MATLYTDVYNSFLSRVTDYDLPAFTEESRESILHGFMVNACSKFQRICKKISKIDLSDRDETNKQFNSTLTDEQIDIITTGMIMEWVKPKYYLDENMRNILNTKDYNMAASPVNVLGGVRNTYSQVKREFESMINKYSFTDEDTV